MTPEQIALVQSSFRRVGSQLPAMTARFYQELFSRDPSLRTLFTTDQALQEARFAEKLTEIVRAMPRLGDLLELTRELGARHVGYGVRVSYYPVVGDSLLAALGAVLGDRFDTDTREAWAVGYNLVAETMLDGAATVRRVRS
jgi:hemoglobin-like flavoprotein